MPTDPSAGEFAPPASPDPAGAVPRAASVAPDRLAALFDEAAALAPAEQPAFVASRCADDPALAAELTALLRHDQLLAADFLAAPPEIDPWSEAHVPEDTFVGTRLGDLVIERPLGQGGMGTVYAARDETLGRTVAVKCLTAAAYASPGERQRMLTEARALARLSHPNVVQVHELRAHGDEFFLVMERIDGVSLARWICDEPRPWRVVLAALVQAGRGLAAVHAIGMVHADIKPDNVLVGADGRVRIVDFGLAHLLEGDADSGRQIAGTPAFMAPERWHGETGDPRGDQFSFCVTAYTCLFGQRPFTADTMLGIWLRMQDPPEPPPAGDVPPAVASAICRGLAREPGDRWPDMDTLLAALDRELARDPEDDLGVARRQRRALTIGLILVTVAIDLYIFSRPTSASELTGRDLVWFMITALVAGLLLLAGFWRALRQNRVNRQLVGLLLIPVGLLLVHRLIALQLGTPAAHTLAVDLLLAAGCAAMAALTFRRVFAGLAALLLLAALLAAAEPARAPQLFSAASLSTFLLALLWWSRSD